MSYIVSCVYIRERREINFVIFLSIILYFILYIASMPVEKAGDLAKKEYHVEWLTIQSELQRFKGGAIVLIAQNFDPT